jgi:GH43 family beta-xylosidase
MSTAVPSLAPVAEAPSAAVSSEALALVNPLVLQRADPWVFQDSDGSIYFTGSVPEYDRIELRRASTLGGLAAAEPRAIWRKRERGPMSYHIWAPELHRINDVWYIYFAAGRAEAIWDIRIWVLSCADADPLTGQWVEKGQLQTDWDSFALDATTFEHRGSRYLVWAQKDVSVYGNSHLYIAKMDTPCSIIGPQVKIATPQYDWERIGFWVNEGPAVIKRNGRIFLTFSASATDANYCMGLLEADENVDLLDPASWVKRPEPVFCTCPENSQYGPGHNSFIQLNGTDFMVYHARNYREIVGDPLNNPDRHARVQPIRWSDDGYPIFGQPLPDGPVSLAARSV